jgi:hypothetical protein
MRQLYYCQFLFSGLKGAIEIVEGQIEWDRNDPTADPFWIAWDGSRIKIEKHSLQQQCERAKSSMSARSLDFALRLGRKGKRHHEMSSRPPV